MKKGMGWFEGRKSGEAQNRVVAVLMVLMMWPLLNGCSIKRMAINKVGDALANGGQTFSSDDDPKLVRDAAPFSLKLMESLLAESPQHRGLLLTAASGFAQYSYAFVQQDFDRLESSDLEASQAAGKRARRLYIRARDYALRGLETRHPAFTEQLRKDHHRAVTQVKRDDVPFLFWAAASWGAAISLSKDDPAMLAEQPIVEAMIDRAFALDPDWDNGALHTLLISYEMVRPGGTAAERSARSREHFKRAMELSRGQLVAPLLSLAEAVALEEQNLKEFDSLLNRALAIDPDAAPQHRLVNLVLQDRARWMLSRIEDLFFQPKAE